MFRILLLRLSWQPLSHKSVAAILESGWQIAGFAPVVGTTCADLAYLPLTDGARAGNNQPDRVSRKR